MKYDPDKPRKRSIRLKGYDYSQAGVYYITVCTHNRELLFGDLTDGIMRLNEYGKMVEYTGNDLPNHNHNIQLDNFIVMPNHVHGIIIINHDGANMVVGADSEPALLQKPNSNIMDCRRSSVNLKHFQSDESINFANHQAPVFGNGIITNISSGMQMN